LKPTSPDADVLDGTPPETDPPQQGLKPDIPNINNLAVFASGN
jgi:hypothetical protein